MRTGEHSTYVIISNLRLDRDGDLVADGVLRVAGAMKFVPVRLAADMDATADAIHELGRFLTSQWQAQHDTGQEQIPLPW